MAEKEYIEREALIKYAEKQEVIIKDGLSIADAMRIQGNVFRRCVETCPAADVAPVKHGHFRSLTFSGDTIICSECKMAYNIFETNGAENFNFCPHCGARMDGGEEND